MIEYKFYYNGKFYFINANSVDLALSIARQRYSAKFARECVLVAAVDTNTLHVLKVVG